MPFTVIVGLQPDLGVAGDILEIDAYRGRSAIALGSPPRTTPMEVKGPSANLAQAFAIPCTHVGDG